MTPLSIPGEDPKHDLGGSGEALGMLWEALEILGDSGEVLGGWRRLWEVLGGLGP